MESNFNWGIIGTGGIANAFANDLKYLDNHNVKAVVSRTKKNAINSEKKRIVSSKDSKGNPQLITMIISNFLGLITDLTRDLTASTILGSEKEGTTTIVETS